MLPGFCKQSIQRIRPGVRTSRGSELPDWEHPSSTITIGGCSVQPAATSLSEDGRVLGITDGLTAYIPIGSDVVAGDHVAYNGLVYEITGEPRSWQSPTGARSHIQLNLKRYSG